MSGDYSGQLVPTDDGSISVFIDIVLAENIGDTDSVGNILYFFV